MFSQNRLQALEPLNNKENDILKPNAQNRGYGRKHFNAATSPNTTLEAFRTQAAKKNTIASVMSVEEVRMNKGLLREISLKKKNQMQATQTQPSDR